MSDLFPTRTGQAQGGASERTMADKVDTSGFRTVIRNNPDGSVTMLRTRGGALHYSTTPVTNTPVEPTLNLRGFVAHKTDAASGVAFDPTQWVATSGAYAEPEIIDRKFAPVIKTYYVSELTTDNNAIAAGTTQWQDVWTLTAGGLRINNIAPTFLGGYTLPTFTGIPFFIPIDNTYGTLAENAGQVKRIFVVGREKVEAVTDGTMVEAPSAELCSKLAREEYRAMTCGPAIDRAENKAVLSQLFYTGHSWDSMDGGWAMGVTEVAMLLTPPCLSQIDSHPAVTQASATPQLQAPYDAGVEESITMPPAPLGVFGVGEYGESDFSGLYYAVRQFMIFPVRGKIMGSPPSAFKVTIASGSRWISSVNTSDSVAGVDMFVQSNTELKHISGADYFRYDEFSHINFPNTGEGSVIGDSGIYNFSTGATVWSYDAVPGVHYAPRGNPSFYFSAQNITGSAEFDKKTQVSYFSVGPLGTPLIEGSITRLTRTGQGIEVVPDDSLYNEFVANPYEWIGEVVGMGTAALVEVAVEPGEVVYISPSVDAVKDRATRYVGGICYDSGQSYGGVNPVPYSTNVFTESGVEQKSLSWTTRDYLLYDDVEQVYVYVLGTFAGVNQDASLVVELVVKTRHHESRKTLYQTALWYFEMLPTQELETGVHYVPLPRLSIFFTPKYRHQGDFRGAAYTTTTEEVPDGEVPGATPVCLMNFILTLQMFDYIGTQEQQDNLQKGVDEQFVPCNLLEMLYAYVFSSDYGQNEYSRYPVTYRNNFNKLYAELFNVQHAIAFKDGAFIDWAASITGHNPSTTTGIYRT